MADLDAVISLSNKARQLYEKGHFERCAQKWRAALAAADALGPEDSVILAAVQTKAARASLLAEALLGQVTQPTALEAFAQYAASAATLRRRRDAGTLLQGTCRPDEVRWQLETVEAECAMWPEKQGEFAPSHAELRTVAAIVGYDTFLHAAESCGQLLCVALEDRLLEPGGEAEQMWISFTCDICDEAVALMVLPRVPSDFQSCFEFDMLDRLQKLKELMRTGPAHRLWHIRVGVALARLDQSGVLAERSIGNEGNVRNVALARQRVVRTANKEYIDAAASGRLRSCELASCGATEAHLRHFNKCSACKAVAYCCKEHQVADWPSHKATCKAARKAAAAAKDAA